MTTTATRTGQLKASLTGTQLKQTARETGIGPVKTFFESQKGTLAAVLPKHVSPDRMLKIALGAMRTTPKLMNCTVESLFGAVVQCSQLGLEPNTPLGHAYLIPFDKKKKQGNEWVVEKTEVQIVFGYKGLIDLARRSGQIVSIAAHEVCENDHFDYSYGLDEKLEHRPAMGNRGSVIAFYAVAKLVGGGHAFEVMGVEQIEEIRNESQGWQSAKRMKKEGDSVWGKHFVQMGRKTVLRRLFNYLPVSIEVATAAALDGRAEVSSQGLEQVLEGDYTVVDNDVIQGEEEGGEQEAAAQDVAFDATGFAKRLKACADLDTLDLMADELRAISDLAARAHLEEVYQDRRAELVGE